MRTSWTGFRGLEQEDAVISLSMGRIFDRSIEHLVGADRAVAALRRILLRTADQVEKGARVQLPADLTDVGAPDVFLLTEEKGKWHSLAPNHWKATPDSQEVVLTPSGS